MYLAAIVSVLLTAGVVGVIMALADADWDGGLWWQKIVYYGLQVIAVACVISSVFLVVASLFRFITTFFR